MGMSMFGNCKCYPKNSKVVAPNPNPLNFKILNGDEIGKNLVAMIRYPDCTNFEGVKVCVFLEMTFLELCGMSSVDPHFSESDSAPFARFKPTLEGLKAAFFTRFFGRKIRIKTQGVKAMFSIIHAYSGNDKSLPRKICWLIVIFLILSMAAVLLSGCHPDNQEKSDNDKAVGSCIAAGGVPKLSQFNGRLIDCIWPPEQVKP